MTPEILALRAAAFEIEYRRANELVIPEALELRKRANELEQSFYDVTPYVVHEYPDGILVSHRGMFVCDDAGEFMKFDSVFDADEAVRLLLDGSVAQRY